MTRLVDDHNDGPTFESLEAEDVTVEHLLGVPEAVPIRPMTVLLPLGLLGMTAAGCQQRDILWAPTLLEEQFDFVIADAQSLFASTGDEFHGQPFAAEKSHRMVDERLECIGDLAGCCAHCGRAAADPAAPRRVVGPAAAEFMNRQVSAEVLTRTDGVRLVLFSTPWRLEGSQRDNLDVKLGSLVAAEG